MAVSFDLFGTLVAIDRPDDPAAAIATELADRGIDVPADWSEAYREHHLDVAEGREIPLHEHVREALASRDRDPPPGAVESAVVAAFDPRPRTRDGAIAAVAAAREYGAVGVLSNVSVPGLAERALRRSSLDAGDFDAVVTSVACGWRKPHPEAFRAAAEALNSGLSDLVHVGDDPRTDGGATDAGARAVLLEETALTDLPERLEDACP